MATALIALLAVLVVGTALYWYFPEPTETWFGRILWTRKWAFRLILLVFALTLLSTGIGYLVVVGALILGAAWLFVLFYTDVTVPRPGDVWPLSEVL